MRYKITTILVAVMLAVLAGTIVTATKELHFAFYKIDRRVLGGVGTFAGKVLTSLVTDR